MPWDACSPKWPASAAPKALRAIIRKATTAEPAVRYPDAAALAADVGALSRRAPGIGLRGDDLLDRSGRLARKHRALLALVLTYIAVRILLFFLPRP